MIKKYLHIILLFSYAIVLAQEPTRFTTKQGLPSNHIYDIQEDVNGFMWFATNRGLVKYDGEKFKTFTIKDGLPNNDTWLLETDYQDKLWYFSKSKYQGYIKNDSIYKFPVEGNLVISPRFINKSKEKLWMVSNGGVRTLEKNKLKVVFIGDWLEYTKKITEASLKYNFKPHLNSFKTDEKKLIYIYENRLIIFNEDYIKIKELKVDLPKNHRNFKIDNQGFLYNDIFYYAMDRGVLFVDFKTYKTKFYSFKKLVNAAPIEYFRAKGLKNEIQISFPGHLLKFDYYLNFKESFSFPKELSKSSYQDSKGNIWLADLTNGISLLSNTQVKANYFLKGKKVQKINKVEGEFYAGVNDDGFYKLDVFFNKFQKILRLKRQNGEIYQIEKSNNNFLYFISSGGSFFKEKNYYNPLKLEQIDNDFTINSGAIKNNIFFNDKNYIIVGSHILYCFKNSKEVKYLFTKDGLITSATFKYNLFYGGADGLYILKKDSLERTKLKNSLLNISIASFLTTKENLFVGTDGRGIYVYNENEITHLKNTDGFSIQKIIRKADNLWLATNKGVHKIALNSKDLENSTIVDSFYETDGLLQNNINDIFVENDTLYAATDVGISKINITDTIYKQNPKLFFKTKNDTLVYKNEARDNVAINFSLQDYVNQDYIKYEYKLLPIQKKWTATQTKNLNFSNLSPNLYQLQVKATDQHFNEFSTTQYINIIPRWWQTTTAKILFSFLALVLFWILIKLIKKQIQRKEQEKSNQEKRIAGLELQALRSQMNPHFVHNSLNAIQYFIQRNEVELSEDYLVKFSKLVRLFFDYSRRKTVTIAEELALLENYLQIEKLRFEDKLSFQIEVDDRIDIKDQELPSMLLQPIVENAVNHGLFHKPDKGKVKIDIKYLDKEMFNISILDDGIGIKKAKEIYKKSSKNYQSHSTEVLQERLFLLKQSKEWQIDYKIRDLSDEPLKSGTEVNITFKQLL